MIVRSLSSSREVIGLYLTSSIFYNLGFVWSHHLDLLRSALRL